MSHLTATVKKHPIAIFYVIIYTCLWVMILSIPFGHPKGSIAVGEGTMNGILFASMISVISITITILLAFLRKDKRFYGYLSAYILLPVAVAFLLPMLS